MPEGKIAMAQANLRLVEGKPEDKTKALGTALSQVEWAFRKGSIMRLGKSESIGLAMIEAIELAKPRVYHLGTQIVGDLRQVENHSLQLVLAERG
jgi:hypothetical protein